MTTGATASLNGYDGFLRAASGRQWKRLGARRRAGTAAPLFSLHSRRSVGIGEIPDLVLLADWCRATGQSIIQLLPLNDVGPDFAPYSAQSSYALDPMYLALDRLHGVDAGRFEKAIASLRGRFAAGRRVDYGIKAAKLEVLASMFDPKSLDSEAFRRFRAANGGWLGDYALYKSLKERFGQSSWEAWPAPYKNRDREALAVFEGENAATVLFHQWLQWQLAEQFAASHRACGERGVYLMGDMPFLVARDSADVWAFQKGFKLGLASGAPPDMYSDKGQRWGMPPYDWEAIAADGWRCVKEKLACAQRYYDLFRVDHVIGAFRLFTVPLSEPQENVALNGVFDPPDETVWEAQGRRILRVMLESSEMLPCGEDLGVVPPVAVKVMGEWAIPGLDVQRWTRDWKGTKDFIAPAATRKNAVSVVSTHDTSLFGGWWREEATPEEKGLFLRFAGLAEEPQDGNLLARRALEKAAESAAVFSVQLIQDTLALGGLLSGAPAEWRVNTPGTVDPRNWSCVLPLTLEEMLALPLNETIREIHKKSGRV